MAVLPILHFPHPVLRQKARKVRIIDSSLKRLIGDMVDTLRDASGVGLAANQVGVLRRVIVIQLPEEEEARVYINPEIIHREGEREVEEGCLSIPGYRGLIMRSVWLKFRALDDSARAVKLKADGLLAQALEHEVDHLNGVLYVDHLKSHEKLFKLEPANDPDHPEVKVVTPSSELVAALEAHLGQLKDRASLPEVALDDRETPASLKIK